MTSRNALPFTCTNVWAHRDIIQHSIRRLLKALSKGFVSSSWPVNRDLSFVAIYIKRVHCMLQVGNKLHGCRFKLQESAKKLHECMNSLEKEHAWQDHTAQLTSLLELHQTAIQVPLHKHFYTQSHT